MGMIQISIVPEYTNEKEPLKELAWGKKYWNLGYMYIFGG